MKRQRGKRLVAFLLAFVLLFGNVNPFLVKAEEVSVTEVTQEELQQVEQEKKAKNGMGMTVRLRVEGLDKTVVQERTVNLPDTYKSLEEYGLSDITDSGSYTPLHVLAQYCEDTGRNPADSISADEDGIVENFLNIADISQFILLKCAINDQCQDETFGIYPLKSGDSIVLYSFNLFSQPAYTYFDSDEMTATTEEALKVKLNAIGFLGSVNLDGAKLVLEDIDGAKISEEKYTSTPVNAEGIGTITINEPGTYRLTVERNDLIRAYAKLTVVKNVSNEEAVEQALNALQGQLQGLDEITDGIILPNAGEKGTSIQWVSKSPEVIESDGNVLKRLVGEDQKIELEASVSRGNVTKTTTFEGTVKGYYMEALSVSPGTLEFDAIVKDYTVYVPEETTVMKMAVNAGDEAEEVIVNGQPVLNNGEQEISLEEKETVIKIEVSYPKTSGPEVVATITVRRSVPGESLPDLPSSWPQHYGNAENNAVVDKTTAIENAELAWSLEGEVMNEWANYAGHPIMVNGNLYAARGQKLQVIDSKTGKILKSTDLAQKVGYYSYISYGDGKIFIPLSTGQVQCFNASTMESLFITKVPGKDLQALSSIFYQDGMIYTGFSTSSGNAGIFAAYETMDTSANESLEEVLPIWSVDTGKGYYGNGAVSVNEGKHIVFGGDAGIITVVEAKTGEEVSRITLAGAVRGALVSAEGYIWAVTKSLAFGDTSGNKLYKIKVDASGAIQVSAQTSLPSVTTVSPVIARGKVIVGGGSFVDKGFLQIYDMNLKLLSEEKTKGEVKSPTVTTAYDDLCVYFVQNELPGGLYVAKISNDNEITISLLHEPEQQNYSMSNVLVGEDGMIYYANDSGYMFAIKPGEKQVISDPDPTPDPDPEQKPDPKPETKPGKENIKTPVIKDTKISTQFLQNDKLNGKMRTSTSKTVTTAEIMIESIQEYAEQGKTSVTMKNIPDTIEASVFEELAKYPEMKLILDCGTYTVSIFGKDVVNTEAELSTKIEKTKSSVSKEQEDKLGEYEQYKFYQEGPLPGKITVVFPLSEAMKDVKELYMYDTEKLEMRGSVVVDSGFAMFTIDEPGEFILAKLDMSAETAEVNEVVGTTENVKENPENTKADSKVLYIIIGLGIIFLAAGAIVIIRKRRKEKSWE